MQSALGVLRTTSWAVDLDDLDIGVLRSAARGPGLPNLPTADAAKPTIEADSDRRKHTDSREPT